MAGSSTPSHEIEMETESPLPSISTPSHEIEIETESPVESPVPSISTPSHEIEIETESPAPSISTPLHEIEIETESPAPSISTPSHEIEIETESPVPLISTRAFSLPVDSENKATKLKILSLAQPHMRAFHLAWISLLACYISTFSTAPLIPFIVQDLNLSNHEISYASILSIIGGGIARLSMGTICDMIGPRYSCLFLNLFVVPVLFAILYVSSAPMYAVVRFLTGISIAMSVSSQFWTSLMFNSEIIGLVNGLTAGWGNMGGGLAQLLTPNLYNWIKTLGVHRFKEWRVACVIPGCLNLIVGLAIFFFGRDLPDGNYRTLRKQGTVQRDEFSKVIKYAVKNYRTWILFVVNGFSSGTEMCINNIIAGYFLSRFKLDLQKAAVIAAAFGLTNSFARPLGGYASDLAAIRFGMRGRLWALYIFQTLGGIFCVCLGKAKHLPVAISSMVFFSITIQAAGGATFGIVPFVSRRSLGLVSGLVGAGGNFVGAAMYSIFFVSAIPRENGLMFMGILIIIGTFLMVSFHFPQWGSMLLAASRDASCNEESYYSSEWNEEERRKGLHEKSLIFSRASVSERGRGYL